MFSFKSRQKLARAEMALREAVAQHQEYLGKLNTALYERILAPARYCPWRAQRVPAPAR